MPEIGNTAVFSQTDANNNTGTMPSWSGSAAPSTLDDAGRAFQGAVTREWNWRNVTLTTGGSSTAYTLTYSTAPAAYYNGQRFAFIVNAANTAAATLNVNALGAKNLRKMVNGTATALAAGDLAAGAYVEVAYNTSGDYFVILNRDLSMLVPEANANGFLRNRIINGDMRIDQRNAGASVTNATASAFYTVDRWVAFGTTASTFSVQQNAGAVTPPSGYKYYVGVTSLAATTPGATDSYFIGQRIEGFNAGDLGYGTASAQTVTLSFWVRSSLTGTFGGSFLNSATNRCYVFSFTISSANTWEYKTVTIAGDTTGTWLTDSGVGLRVTFDLGGGTSNKGIAGSWGATSLNGVTGGVNVIGTNGATFYLTGVQLEAGSVATPFERRPYGQELALCQRYYQLSYNSGTVPAAVTSSGAIMLYPADSAALTRLSFGPHRYVVPMRSTPTVVLYGTNGTANAVSLYNSSATNLTFSSFNTQSSNGIADFATFSTSATSGASYLAHYTASAEL